MRIKAAGPGVIVLREVLRIVNGCSGESSTHKITRSQGGIERSLDRKREGERGREGGRGREGEGGRGREREGEGERERGRGREGERVQQSLLHIYRVSQQRGVEGSPQVRWWLS